MISILKKPFPVNTWRWYRLRAVGFGLFVFLFLFLFKPFRLDLYPVPQLFFNAIIYGTVTSAVILTGGWFFIKMILPRIHEERWTLGKQIFLNIVLMVAITIFNILVTQVIHNILLPFWWHLVMLKWVLMLGVLPVALAELFSYNYYLQQHIKSAQLFSKHIPPVFDQAIEKYENLEIGNKILIDTLQETKCIPNDNAFSQQDYVNGKKIKLTIRGENQSDKLIMVCGNLLAIQALDNYVNVFWENDNTLHTTMLRNTLTNISEQLNHIPFIYRSHRGWLVNTQRVLQVEGNAQGLKLYIDFMPQPVPVSRANIAGYRKIAEQYLVMQD